MDTLLWIAEKMAHVGVSLTAGALGSQLWWKRRRRLNTPTIPPPPARCAECGAQPQLGGIMLHLSTCHRTPRIRSVGEPFRGKLSDAMYGPGPRVVPPFNVITNWEYTPGPGQQPTQRWQAGYGTSGQGEET